MSGTLYKLLEDNLGALGTKVTDLRVSLVKYKLSEEKI
jgi:hypothetical protein